MGAERENERERERKEERKKERGRRRRRIRIILRIGSRFSSAVDPPRRMRIRGDRIKRNKPWARVEGRCGVVAGSADAAALLNGGARGVMRASA